MPRNGQRQRQRAPRTPSQQARDVNRYLSHTLDQKTAQIERMTILMEEAVRDRRSIYREFDNYKHSFRVFMMRINQDLLNNNLFFQIGARRENGDLKHVMEMPEDMWDEHESLLRWIRLDAEQQIICLDNFDIFNYEEPERVELPVGEDSDVEEDNPNEEAEDEAELDPYLVELPEDQILKV